MKVKKTKNNQEGVLVFDFIFSFMVVLGLFQMFYYLTYTLIAAQATQYVMFASSRNFFAGHHTVTEQTQRAEKKFNDLTQETALAAFYQNERIKLSDFQAREFTEYPTGDKHKYLGTSVTFDSKVLDVRIPLLGSTGSMLEDNGFKAQISAFLYREPTALECRRFNEQRAEAIKKLNPKYDRTEFGEANDIGVFSDNGC